MTRLITDTKRSFTIFLIMGLISFGVRALATDNIEVDQSNNQNIFVRPLLQFKTPHSLEFCGEPVPLERRDVWVPACGGHEVPQAGYLYVFNPRTHEHGWLNTQTDIVQSESPF